MNITTACSFTKNLMESMGYTVTSCEPYEYLDSGITIINCSVSDHIPGRWISDLVHSVQTIVRHMVAQKTGLPESEIHFTIDINEYIARNIQELEAKALMMANRAISFDVKVHMDPMPPFQRKIVHAYLQKQKPEISTESFGLGMERHIVLEAKKELRT